VRSTSWVATIGHVRGAVVGVVSDRPWRQEGHFFFFFVFAFSFIFFLFLFFPFCFQSSQLVHLYSGYDCLTPTPRALRLYHPHLYEHYDSLTPMITFKRLANRF
jgi:hypothetical protein